MADKRDAERLRKAAARIRKQAARSEDEIRRTLLPAWRRIRIDLDAQAHALALKIEEAEAAGVDVAPTWLHKQDRYVALVDQVEKRIGELAQLANQPVTAHQALLIERAAEEARGLVEIALGPAGPKAIKATMADWNRLPVAATEQIIGNAANGQPLHELLAEIAPDARARAEQIIARGMAAGKNPKLVARELRSVSDQAMSRLMTIARTEALRAQRESMLRSYQANSGIVAGWTWDAALDETTCEMCIAENGSEHTLDEDLESHPNCRCTAIPITKSWADLGLGHLELGETSVAGELETGPEWFGRQPESVQAGILGPGKLEALQEGKINWPDMVAKTPARNGWPPMKRAASLAEALENAAAR